MSQSNAAADDLVLTCTPEKTDETIVFAYEVTNRGTDTWYVMDAIVGVDPGTRKPRLEPGNVSVWQGADGYAHVLVGWPPVPTDRSVGVRVIPVAIPLAPRETLRRTLELRLPLAEQSAYFPVGNLRDYRIAEIQGMTLLVDALSGSAPGLRVEPAGEAISPRHVRALSANLDGDLRRLRASFRSQGLHLMLRAGAFPRPG